MAAKKRKIKISGTKECRDTRRNKDGTVSYLGCDIPKRKPKKKRKPAKRKGRK